MKIAQIVNTFPPYWSGTGLVAYNLSKELMKIGIEIEVFTPKTNKNENYDYGNLKVNLQSPLLKIGLAPLIPQLLAIKNFDLLHLHYPYYFGGELISLVSGIRKIPLVITYHNDVWKNGFLGNIVDFHSKIISSLILNQAKKICVMSKEFLDESKTLEDYKFSSKIEFIPQGIDTEKFCIKKISTKNNKTVAKQIILFVRMLDNAHYHSGLNYLIESLSYINFPCELLIVGDGELKPYYEKQVLDSNLENMVKFIGAVSNEDLTNFYSSANMFVLPSSETENASLVLLEAMSSGLPVIASDVGGNRNLIYNNVDGFLIPPKSPHELAKKLNYLLENPEISEEMGRKGAEKIRNKYSWLNIASRYQKLYSEIL